MKFQIAGLNHRTAPVEIRERAARSTRMDFGGALDCLRQRPGLLEGMILSTCNRVEIAITADEQTDPEEAIECFLSEIGKSSATGWRRICTTTPARTLSGISSVWHPVSTRWSSVSRKFSDS